MKMYVEEKDLPKDCATCKYYVLNCSDTYSCIKQNWKAIHPNFSDGMGCRHENCPLQSLAEYNKQVIKETLDGLIISLFACFSSDEEFTRDEIIDWLKKIKDEI